jgi:hypothetical protein
VHYDARVNNQRPNVWILGKVVARTVSGRKCYEYFTGAVLEDGSVGARRSVYRADAFKFSSYDSVLECASTYPDIRDSDDWEVLPVFDPTRPQARPAALKRKTGS